MATLPDGTLDQAELDHIVKYIAGEHSKGDLSKLTAKNVLSGANELDSHFVNNPRAGGLKMVGTTEAAYKAAVDHHGNQITSLANNPKIGVGHPQHSAAITAAKKAAETAHESANVIAGHAYDMGVQRQQIVDELYARAAKNPGDKKLQAQTAEMVKHLEENVAKQASAIEADAQAISTKIRTKVQEATTHAPEHVFDANAVAAGTSVGSAGKAAGAIIKVGHTEAKAMGVDAAAYTKATTFGKMTQNLKANFNVAEIKNTGEIVKRGTFGKILHGGIGVGSIIVGGMGLKKVGQALGMVSPGTDEKGQELPPSGGDLMVGALELGAAGFGVYQMVKSGKAAGISK